jgi:hypothetical protein
MAGDLVGHIPTVGELDDRLYMVALGWREAAKEAKALWDYIEPLGSDGLQGEPWAMSPEKADAYFQSAEYASTLGKVYMGMIDQSAWNFDDALAPARGGK